MHLSQTKCVSILTTEHKVSSVQNLYSKLGWLFAFLFYYNWSEKHLYIASMSQANQRLKSSMHVVLVYTK